ncbi:hypothetical protein EKE94_17360 [Mesobaculum littorinae]|uniref:Uncharacterized protein n=1 Tax=Mesobaculum littorinae TaxID=2486419 RepID=A0A438AD89_9RHOB|nr:hypothetical protein [Mesobaculum littorinae]RVV96648.1 hypothetical protein EKE94_17360 [Mesobaculum littorinae]
MAEEWILDVLADLRAYAGEHDLPALAAHLDRVSRVAERELVLKAGECAIGAHEYDSGIRYRPDGSAG